MSLGKKDLSGPEHVLRPDHCNNYLYIDETRDCYKTRNTHLREER